MRPYHERCEQARHRRDTALAEFIAKRSLRAEPSPPICRNKQPGRTDEEDARKALMALKPVELADLATSVDGREIHHRRHHSDPLAGLATLVVL